MKVSSVKLTGIINEFLVRVAEVHNPGQAEATSKALKALLMPEETNEQQPITQVNIITASYLKVNRDTSRVVLINKQYNQRVEIPHNFEAVVHPSTATLDIAVAYLKKTGFNILHYSVTGSDFAIITDTLTRIPHPHPNDF